MQRPPQMPSILSTRQAYQWINRIAQKHKQLTSLNLTEAQSQDLNQWIEVEFAQALLTLEDANAMVKSSNLNEATDNPVMAGSLRAFRLLKEFIATHKQNAHLDVELLRSLNAAVGNGVFRQNRLAGSTVRPENLPMIVENVCRWFASHSIRELNPVEQAAIAFLRFLEIAPFEQHNEGTACLTASFFTLRQGLPPIIIKPERRTAYDAALSESLRTNTQPMVELVAGSIEQSLDEMLNWLQSN
jgi:Fic family protein